MARRGVFKIINRRTGRVYVGSSNTNIDRLIYSYWQRLYAGDHHNYDLQSDFDYYGRSNFTVEIVSGSCYSEDEVRSLREQVIFENRFNTYNEDVPVHYGGGNPNGSFGGYHAPRHNIIDDLIGIIDKSNLNYSYKSTLKSDVKNGNITNKTELDKKIKYYQELPGLLDILNKSDLKQSEKDEIKSNIKNGGITNKNQLDDVITHYQTVRRLLAILNKSDLKQSYKDEIIPYIKSGKINNENQLNNKINFYKQLPVLLSILDNSNIKQVYKNRLRTDIRKGVITSKYQLNDEIRVYEIMGKYDYNTLKKLCDQYCSYSVYSSWTQKRDKITFKNSENNEKKVISMDALEKEINSLKNDILHSQPSLPKSRLKVFELAKIICDALSFNSYELHNRTEIIFDDKYKLEIKKLEDVYEELDLTKDYKFKTTDRTINNCLNETRCGDNFSNTAENIIIEYCEVKKIPFWDLINQEDTILLYDDYLTISSVQDCIEALDNLYKEFNLKLGPLHLKNIYHVFKRFHNKPSDGETESVKRLLSILSESNLPITTKIEVKDDINKGNIYSEDSLNEKIKSLMSSKYKTSRRKIIRTSANTDSKEYYQQDKTRTENKSGNEKTNETNDSLEKLYEIYGYYFCPTCGKKIPNIIKTCDECSKKQNLEDEKTNSQKTPENPEDTLEKLNEIFGYHFCPTCGKKIPNIMETCDDCSKSNK